MFKFSKLLDKKFKKTSSKVKFSGLRFLPINLPNIRFCILISINYGLISSSEMESCRKAIKKVIGKSKRIKILIRMFPYIPLTGKPLEVRMGRGKGSRIRKWVYFIKPGKILFEIKNISHKFGRLALKAASKKLSVKTKILAVKKK